MQHDDKVWLVRVVEEGGKGYVRFAVVIEVADD
jgi:hypothetical protein